ncbi:hypothetical protein N1I87_16535 [Bacillus sp. FSL W8-0102]|uniref:hypothetical protein n=1 Tax=Bacillus sp. FSL W8-0102 TaxID=2978205 RepID=UPI0030F80881
MIESEEFEIIYEGNVSEFEEQLLYKSEQEVRKGRPGLWCKIADIYVRQLTIIRYNPFPEEPDDISIDETPPSIKHINKNTEYENFYRWGIHGGRTGNHRIIYAIHNFHKVIFLYYFDKQYNGLIKRDDLIPAELNYETYCALDPSLY